MSRFCYKSVPKSGENGTLGHGTPSRVRKGKRDNVPGHFVSQDSVPLSQEQRFAGWLAGASAEQVERFKLAGERRLTPEQMELHRLCGERILKEHASRGRKFADDVLADARRWAAFPKLHGALSDGLPVALRGDNLEVF
jgi:hypothetical protein